MEEHEIRDLVGEQFKRLRFVFSALGKSSEALMEYCNVIANDVRKLGDRVKILEKTLLENSKSVTI